MTEFDPSQQIELETRGQILVPASNGWELDDQALAHALDSIEQVETFGEQHDRIKNVVAAIAAPANRLVVSSKGKARYTSHDVSARFRIYDNNCLRLGYVLAQGQNGKTGIIGYKTAHSSTEHPAFAMTEIKVGPRTEYGYATKDPTMRLTDAAREVGSYLKTALALELLQNPETAAE